MGAPVVSIITPCYNGERYLAQCIESVQAQTFQHWEMLIVDDCSTDSSASIVQRYAENDSRIIYLKTEKASGSPTLPRNIGMDYAHGRYVAFLDCDDLWAPTKLEEQLAVFAERQCALVYANYEKMSENGERADRLVQAPESVSFKRLHYGCPLGCLTVIVDTELTGKFRFVNQHQEDYIAWLTILKQHGLAYNTNTTLAYYRETSGSVSRNKLRVIPWQWNVYRNVLNLNMVKATYYFICYAYNGFVKHLK